MENTQIIEYFSIIYLIFYYAGFKTFSLFCKNCETL